MVTIKDFIDNNENVPIIIEVKHSRNRYDPLSKEVWRGMLYEIPEKLHSFEIIDAGFGLAAQCNILKILESGDCDV